MSRQMINFTHILFILASLFIDHDIALFRDIDSVQELSDIFVFDGCRLLNKSGRLADGFDGVLYKKNQTLEPVKTAFLSFLSLITQRTKKILINSENIIIFSVPSHPIHSSHTISRQNRKFC